MTDLIAADEAMQQVQRLIARVASSHLSVVLLGETGAGKEVCAEEVHRRSPRSAGPFVRLNCAALPPALLESELFGYERGAFTGALSCKPGLLEAASGGTLFLDEIGDMPRETQAKLLRALESQEILRVGATVPRRVDFRLVAATNEDLIAAVEAGRFRKDLYFRINGMSITIPPLRRRPADIEALARCFVARFSAKIALALSAASLERLRAHAWPGNVRELRNVIERAAVLCEGATIEPWHLGIDEAQPTTEQARAIATIEGARGLTSEMRNLERVRIAEALRAAHGNQYAAARALGISRGKLRRRLARR
jgi:transcriptional regulator with PAS, ATPase and Fis domain